MIFEIEAELAQGQRGRQAMPFVLVRHFDFKRTQVGLLRGVASWSRMNRWLGLGALLG